MAAQPVTPFLAEATRGLWVPASEVGVPNSLFQATGGLSPRLGLTYRPFARSDFVVRAGYGLFYNMFTGNRAASSIVGPPYWAWESVVFSRPSNQRWETAWPDDPEAFIQPSIGEAPAWNIEAAKTHQWNISIQTALPLRSALTVAYVGTRIRDQHAIRPYNVVPPGQYPNLQAALPYPEFGDLNVLGNWGRSWYNALQLKWERRFASGLSFLTSYSFAKDLNDMTPSGEWGTFVPFAPEGYLRGRSPYDRTHILAASAVWEVPFGRHRQFGSSLHRVLDVALGGWQLSGINSFVSGAPLSVNVPGATLGNAWGTRATLVGDPGIDNPTRDLWFNPAAFAAPPLYQWGNSGVGIMEGPATHVLDLGLMKNFHVTESKYFQFRWEMFNALNRVNLGNPGTTLGASNFGRILSAGAPRTMQLGLKFLF